MIERTNRRGKDRVKIAVDLGYGYTKAVNEMGQKIIFPSVVARKQGSNSLGNALGEGLIEYVVGLKEGGLEEEFLVGEAAVSSVGAVRAWEEDPSQHKNTKVLLSAAARLLNPLGGTLDIAVGLPIMTYGSQKTTLQEFLRRFEGEIRIADGEYRRIRFNNVWVFPQAGGAFYYALLGPNGNLKDRNLLTGSVGVLDVGYRTTDYLLLENTSRGLIVREDMSGSIDLGYNWVYQEVSKQLEGRIGQALDIQRVENILERRDGVVMFRGKPIDLTVDAEIAAGDLAQALMGKLKRIWNEELNTLTSFIVAGGGGQRLFPHIQKVNEGARLVSDPIFANAFGYLASWRIFESGRR
ncbi:MAG: ParM/StbA family protein [Candidatus Methanomethyliaceae archaeon]